MGLVNYRHKEGDRLVWTTTDRLPPKIGDFYYMTTSTLEQKTCSNCPHFKHHNDGSQNGWCLLFDRFAKQHHPITATCEQEIEAEATRQAAQQEFEQHLEQQVQLIAPDPISEIEIDSVQDSELGKVYRVWDSYHFLGIFYQSVNGTWLAQSCNSDPVPCNTPEEAQIFVVALSRPVGEAA
ncbi:MAG TPA: hypothetical protein VK203_07340 [Nostocaceae cyanobacterium]|nr:hypothetical protein [Nostocaceae cyanobacterium]